jgi:Transposase DDE domain group 1
VVMADPAGEADKGALRLDFDRRVMLRFHGTMITSDGGLLAYRELDDVLALTTSGGERLAEARTGRNRRHLLVGLLRQSVFGRLAGYEDVNDADRLCRDPAMRWVVGGDAPMGRGASASQMGRFETEWLVQPENLAALADLPGQWIEAVHQRRQPKIIVLDMDSSESPTYGEQEGSAYNGHFGCTPAITRCSCSTNSAIWSGVRCVRATCTAPRAGERCWGQLCRATGAR